MLIKVMAAGKENVNRAGKSTRLPEERIMMLDRKEEDNSRNMRGPLKTLSSNNQQNVEESAKKKAEKRKIEENLAGPSHGGRLMDTRFITHRTNNEELDWQLNVFKDTPPAEEESKTAKTIKRKSTESHDEEKETKEVHVSSQMETLLNTAACEDIDKSVDPAIAAMCEVTPLHLSPIFSLRAFTLKKSLYRPPSRATQSTRPVAGTSCNDDSNKNMESASQSPACIDELNGEYTVDNLTYMQMVEGRVPYPPVVGSVSRTCVINWIIKVNGANGSPLVVQLTCWYLDKYLSSTLSRVTQLQVIAAACYWLATKSHGRPMSARRLVKYSGDAFNEKELKAVEQQVLRKLQFQAMVVTPYEFIPYLSWSCDTQHSGLVEAAAVFIFHCALMTDKHLTNEYPSVLAAAAVKNAVILLRQKTWLKNLKNCSVYKEAEKKARNLNGMCAQMRDAVRVVASFGYEYKALMFKFAGPPYYISTKMVRALSYRDIALIDAKEREKRKTQ